MHCNNLMNVVAMKASFISFLFFVFVLFSSWSTSESENELQQWNETKHKSEAYFEECTNYLYKGCYDRRALRFLVIRGKRPQFPLSFSSLRGCLRVHRALCNVSSKLAVFSLKEYFTHRTRVLCTQRDLI